MAGGENLVTERLDKHRAELLSELREIKRDGKETLTLANKNHSSIAEIKGRLPGMATQIHQNTKDIRETRGWFMKMLMSSAASGGATGAIAAVLVKALGG